MWIVIQFTDNPTIPYGCHWVFYHTPLSLCFSSAVARSNVLNRFELREVLGVPLRPEPFSSRLRCSFWCLERGHPNLDMGQYQPLGRQVNEVNPVDCSVRLCFLRSTLRYKNCIWALPRMSGASFGSLLGFPKNNAKICQDCVCHHKGVPWCILVIVIVMVCEESSNNFFLEQGQIHGEFTHDVFVVLIFDLSLSLYTHTHMLRIHMLHTCSGPAGPPSIR